MSRTRIALITPRGPLYRYAAGTWKRGLRYRPLTLSLLAALVPPELEAEIVCLDESVELIPDRIEADLVGISIITGSAPRGYAIADACRARGSTVVLGGPHATLLPEEAARHADAVVIGYAESSWPQLLRDWTADRLQPRYRQEPQHDLRAVPSLADRPPDRRYLGAYTIEPTRGCVHDCAFCVVPTAWGRRPYQRPIAAVIDELRQVPQKNVLFLDLNLIADRSYAAELFTALIPLRKQWAGLATTTLGRDPDLVALAARSGCRGLLLGFESLVPNALRQSDKGFNSPRSYRETVRLLHQHRIAVQGCFVFGLDHDEADVFAATAAFTIDAGVDLPRFAVVTPFPGTPLYARLQSEGRILCTDWERYDGQHVVFQPQRMSPQQLQDGLRLAWRQSYRWPAILRRVARPHPTLPLLLAANAGYRWYARRLPHQCREWLACTS